MEMTVDVKTVLAVLIFGLLAACWQRPEPDAIAQADSVAFPGTDVPIPSPAGLIRNVTLLVGNGERIDQASVLLNEGKITAVGKSLQAPAGALVVDGTGKWVTPGLIDVHSHLGVGASPSHESNDDVNEATDPNTAQVWAEHSVTTQDPQFTLALAGGVTSLQILPGSANLFGGRGITLKNVPARTVQAMKFPGAPYGLKMACGENPKRVYGRYQERAPETNMGNVAGYREAWIKAADYLRQLEHYQAEKSTDRELEPPLRDLQLETLAEVLRGNILIHNHCYRAEEMAIMIDLAKEFGYRISTFHHAVEAYKIADLLAENDICAAMWTGVWGFKDEAFDMVDENVALVDQVGACALIHSDSEVYVQHLNQEAARAMAAGNRIGYNINRAQAIAWVTLNPARALGIAELTGSVEPGKMADLVLWDGDPFSVYSRAEKVYIDGALLFDRLDENRQPVMDSDLGVIDPQGQRL
jgi:imidazolonepropionase-like amidohydrolase